MTEKRVNKYAGPCGVCGARVPAKGGLLGKKGGAWYAVHLACEGGTPGVIDIQIGGNHYTRNARGRCEDAPCCGCCTI